jgi:hypothetical protein
MNGTIMTSLLKTLGDDWHKPHPYVSVIHSVLPDADFEEAEAIEKRLLQVYEDEHFDFKSLKTSKPIQTLYESEIEIALAKKKILKEDINKEEIHFNKLLEKFKDHEPPEESSEKEKVDEEEGEEEEEELTDVKQNGKGQKACRRTLKAEAVRKAKLAQGIKTSMASSQVRLMELNEELEKLTKLCEYYNHYSNATKYYLRSMKQLTLSYTETKDLTVLIKGIRDMLSNYEMMMRRYVPMGPCLGEPKGLCETHLLPLYSTVYPKDNFRPVWKCCASP